MKKFVNVERDVVNGLRGRLTEAVKGLMAGGGVEDIGLLTNVADGRLWLGVHNRGKDWIVLNGGLELGGDGMLDVDGRGFMVVTGVEGLNPVAIFSGNVVGTSGPVELEELEMEFLRLEDFGDFEGSGSLRGELGWFWRRYCEVGDLVGELGRLEGESPLDYAERIGNRESVNLRHLMDIMDEMRWAVEGLWAGMLWAEERERGRIERLICRLIGNLRRRLGGGECPARR